VELCDSGLEIYDAYDWLRANNPLGLAEPEGFDAFWVVTKHFVRLSQTVGTTRGMI
jgi:hypothetical protein